MNSTGQTQIPNRLKGMRLPHHAHVDPSRVLVWAHVGPGCPLRTLCMCTPPSSPGPASLSRCLCSWDTQYDSHRSLPFCVACMLQFHKVSAPELSVLVHFAAPVYI